MTMNRIVVSPLLVSVSDRVAANLPALLMRRTTLPEIDKSPRVRSKAFLFGCSGTLASTRMVAEASRKTRMGVLNCEELPSLVWDSADQPLGLSRMGARRIRMRSPLHRESLIRVYPCR
jgi:hypothetical protein